MSSTSWDLAIARWTYGPLDVTAATAGLRHSCAIRGSNGSVICVGESTQAQCGAATSNAAPIVPSTNPMVVPGVTGAVAIAAGTNHTCALLNNGDVKCWGANDYGQLGIGELNPYLGPVTATLATNAHAIAAGGDTTCILSGTGRPYCWGRNTHGQAGIGSTATTVPIPTLVTWGADGPP